jgi:hypothetical protein
VKVANHRPAFVVPFILILLAGCGSSPSSNSSNSQSGGPSAAPLASGGATNAYVLQTEVNGSPFSILQFPLNSSGSVSPASTLLPPAALGVYCIATDNSGQIYVGGLLGGAAVGEILVYAAGSSGSATPVRTIMESSPNLDYPVAMAVDATGSLYVANIGADIDVYSSTATGFAAPTNTIEGSLTQLSYAAGIAVDASHHILVANEAGGFLTGNILVFGSGATGNVAPSRIIAPGANFSQFVGITTDSNGNIYATEDQAQVTAAAPGDGAIVEYAGGTGGSANPIKTISSSALSFGGDLEMDTEGNLYTVNLNYSTGARVGSVIGFGPAASGNVTPAVSFTSTAWASDGGVAIAVH